MENKITNVDELYWAIDKLKQVSMTSIEDGAIYFAVRYNEDDYCNYFADVILRRLFLVYDDPIRTMTRGGNVVTVPNISINSTRASFQGLYNMIKSISECEDGK